MCKATLGEIPKAEITQNLFEQMNDSLDLCKFAAKFNDVDETVVFMGDSKITICGLNKEIIDKIYLEFIGLL
jgi:hypothetical protein